MGELKTNCQSCGRPIKIEYPDWKCPPVGGLTLYYCPQCRASENARRKRAEERILSETKRCYSCGGTGKIKGHKCMACNGKGKVKKTSLDVPSDLFIIEGKPI